MRIVAATFLVINMHAVVAAERADSIIESKHPEVVSSPDGTSEGATELDPITVYGQRPVWGLNPSLKNSLPCIGCDGRVPTSPLALTIAKAIGTYAIKPFFQQPRCRGEPNDEAMYYALRAAQNPDGSSGGFDGHPNPGLYNWEYDEKTCR